ncbi:hypothetical protein Back11_13680 [Paenibacillus baekrokdamisoli]|uniref:Uncharacterized protein n=1 Tax=Paenibacillus baekrokdamisoli TaxID=1712516 RepID=A0A3G9J5G4_9BACL|nr:hypothetical protein [Paenibacillus baekrokdamisoli]MBB3070673.1 hypothetical protein [Paenibacillus baekrokdamisoli]BBH20023.1 hypothetical protein Back11_13680 [Paenibacillus baekrokdamisoli]
MKKCIQFWIHEYENQNYIRFSIVDNINYRAVRIISFFAKNEMFEGFGKVGVLRIDLASIMTKAIPTAKQRVIALKNSGYQELMSNPIMPFEHYYVKAR